jgi:hypothetical protein
VPLRWPEENRIEPQTPRRRREHTLEILLARVSHEDAARKIAYVTRLATSEEMCAHMTTTYTQTLSFPQDEAGPDR